MATIYKTDGTEENIQPKNGKDFKLKELQPVVEGYVEIVRLRDGRIMVVNEEGMLMKLPYNRIASQIAGQPIVGNVLVCERWQIK